jgi:hypothetical protein
MRYSLLVLSVLSLCAIVRADDDKPKPKAAVFPLAGSASQDARDKVGFSLRLKLDRDGHFEPIDGPTMAEIAGDKPVELSAKPDDLVGMAQDESPVILIWGQLDAAGTGFKLTVKTRDLRDKDGAVKQIEKKLAEPTDLRFAMEDVLQSISGVGKFSHPVEESVTNDAKSLELWAKNPNLMTDGDFKTSGPWTALLRSEKYPAPVSDDLPETDKVVIYHEQIKGKDIGDGIEKGAIDRHVLAMKLSKDVAESNGLACLSDAIPIEQNTRYRIQFKYKSDGPSLHVFVKGYIKKKDISGTVADLQSYECQVPPSGPTKGEWKTVVCDLNPQNVSGSPNFLKVDLYAYLGAGTVEFDDVQLKAVGEQTRHAVDDAIKPPASDASH